MHNFCRILAFYSVIYSITCLDCQKLTSVAKNYSWPDDSGNPQQFKPINNRTCQWDITVPTDSYITLTLVGKFNNYDTFTITDSSGLPYQWELLNNRSQKYYLPAGVNSLSLQCLPGSSYNSTISISVNYYKLPITAPKPYQIDSNTKPFLLRENDSYNQPITINRTEADKYFTISAASTASDMLPLASYMVYDGDSILGRPLGSLFFYAQLRLFPFVSFTQTVTLVNLDNSSPTVLLINLRENFGNISTHFFLWWGSDQGSWITQITSTRNGPGAITLYRPNGDTEFVGDFSFTEISGAASFKILDGPPLKQMNNSLYIYRQDMDIKSYWPIRLDGVLNTYLAENSTVTVDFEYGKDTNALFTKPIIGRKGFLASQNSYITSGRNRSITFEDGNKSRFNFLVSNTRVNFDNSSKGGSLIVTINDVDIHNNIFMKQQISLNSSKSDIELLVNASGYSMEIDYIESPNHNSDFYFQFEFGKPTIFGPEINYTTQSLDYTTQSLKFSDKNINVLILPLMIIMQLLLLF